MRVVALLIDKIKKTHTYKHELVLLNSKSEFCTFENDVSRVQLAKP